jgi:hypothetical protein
VFNPSISSANNAALPTDITTRLEQTWSTGSVAPVHSRELPEAVAALMAYHLRVGFFEDRLVGMERRGGFGPDGSFEVALAPNRKKAPISRDAHADGACGLCRPTFPSERGLSWRTWRIWPNAFPYVPAQSQHILLTCADHVAQSFSPQILGDMIDFQAHAAAGRQLTMHYNGTAGNSQFHLHWQATREVLPLQRQLDGGTLPTSPVVVEQGGRVATYDQGIYAGLLVEGDKSFVQRWAARIVERLEKDPVTRGAYNLLLLQPIRGRARLVVIPRRADLLKPTMGSFGQAGVGAFTAGGIVVMPRAEIPDDFAAALEPAMRSTIVPPAELGWLDDLRRAPRAAVLQLQGQSAA